MKTLRAVGATALLAALCSACATVSSDDWLAGSDCRGSELLLEVFMDDERVFGRQGIVCPTNAATTGQLLSFDFRPEREIRWSGLAEETQTSPADAELSFGLWLASDESSRGFWVLGTSVSSGRTTWMNALHVAELHSESTTCIADGLCIRTTGSGW